MQPKTYQQADIIPTGWPAQNVDRAAAERVAAQHQQPLNNRLERHEFEMPPLGTWRLDWIGKYGEFSVLVEIPVDTMQPSEGDWEHALRLRSTQQYIEWQRQGYAPPPPEVITKRGGELRIMNRRRWLAAREAGVETLVCWYSPSDDFLPKWRIER